MGRPVDPVDLFVVGTDFYLGSTRSGRLKDGWCDFRALGQKQVRDYFGNSRKLGAIWYLATRVSPRALRSFEEHKRQMMWLGMQGADVARILIDDTCQTTGLPGPLVSGGEFRCRTEEAAIAALRKACLAPDALVISGDHERPTPLLSFLDERYDRQKKIVLVPPDFGMQDNARELVHLTHDDLEEARLRDEPSWVSYMRSKNRGVLATRWSDNALSELRPWLTRLLNKDPGRTDAEILEHVKEKIARFLTSHPVDDRHLAQDIKCIEFIARKLIEAVDKEVRLERHVPSIRSGRDLIEQAAIVYPAIEICKNARSQILAMTGNEEHFDWVLKAFAAGNREMRAWESGPFPHSRLLGPAAPSESDSVIASPRLSAMRYFETLSGENLPFFPHMKCRGTNKRIHYRVDQDRRRLLIGYVGEHLPL